ncbi:MAG: hypothetical protein RLY86_2163 [Pseudomonadota bacterium]|jgi:uncharacterized protein YbaP (TraB family)
MGFGRTGRTGRTGRIVSGLVLAVGLVIGGGIAGAARAAPALWKVSDADSTLYLYGTIHVLKPDTVWQTPALATALTEAQEVWFEIDPQVMENPVEMGRVFPLMMDPANPLSTRLGPDLAGRFGATARGLGVDPVRLEPFKPVIASTMLVMAAIQREGYSAESGVDKVLRRAMGDRPIRQLETLEQQIGFFTGMPMPVQVALVDQSLEEIADIGRLDRMVAAWAAGDMDGLDTVFLADLRRDHPDAYDVFVRARNRSWTDTLAVELAGSGTDFVAVGALHLVGADGLPTLLAARGFKVERVE